MSVVCCVSTVITVICYIDFIEFCPMQWNQVVDQIARIKRNFAFYSGDLVYDLIPLHRAKFDEVNITITICSQCCTSIWKKKHISYSRKLPPQKVTFLVRWDFYIHISRSCKLPLFFSILIFGMCFKFFKFHVCNESNISVAQTKMEKMFEAVVVRTIAIFFVIWDGWSIEEGCL